MQSPLAIRPADPHIEAMTQPTPRLKVSINGSTYRIDGRALYSATTGERIPDRLAAPLLVHYVEQLSAPSATPEELEEALEISRGMNQANRSLEICERLVAHRPESNAWRATLCALLRTVGKPAEAVERSRSWLTQATPALLTTIGASMADLEQWEDANKLVRRAIAMQSGKADPETLSLRSRILKERPDLS